MGLVRVMAHLLHRLPAFPVTPDQLLLLEEDNTCDPGPFLSTFGVEPMPLADGLNMMLG
jgi:hypothetical protein